MSTTAADRPVRSMRKARGSGHLRRAEMLTAAERIFNAEGYEGATIRKIADEVGVSPTALYMHFQDKSDIMLEIGLHALEELLVDFDALAGSGLERPVYLRRHMERFLRFGFERPAAYQLLYGLVPPEISERRHAVFGHLHRQCFEKVQTAVEDCMAKGAIRGDLSARAVAECLIGSCHGALTMRMANPYAPWTEPEVLSRTLLDGLFTGFEAR